MPDHLTRAALALDPTLKLPEPTADELVDRIRELSYRFRMADGNSDAYYKLKLIYETACDAQNPPPVLRRDWTRETHLRVIDLLEKALENEH